MAKLPYEDEISLKGLEDKKKTTSTKSKPAAKKPARNEYDSLDTLEDIGYEEPSEDVKKSERYQAILKKLRTPAHSEEDQAKFLAEYNANKPSRMVAAEDDLGNAPTVDPKIFDLGNAPAVSPETVTAFNQMSSKQASQMDMDIPAPRSPAMEQPSQPAMPAAVQPPTPVAAPTAPVAKSLDQPLANKMSLLEEYKQLMQQKHKTNSNLDMLQGGNQIAQAIASGYGGKIGDGSEAINQLRKTAEIPVEALLGQSKAVDTQNELQINDPNSDISKFARERAVVLATKMGVSPEKIKSLDGMSAKQLEKLGLYKPDSMNGSGDLYFTTIMDENGNPQVVAANKTTGEIVKTLGTKGFASQVMKDADGNIIEVKRNTDNPINSQGTATAPTQNSAGKVTQKGADVTYDSPTALKKMSPKLYEKFNKVQEDFVKDMKESREVATGATVLSGKLIPGENGQIDSGLLGGIQTQAAKMAGQKGVLTDQDLVKFAGAGGVAASIGRIIDGSMFGEMSENDVKFFQAFAKKMRSATEQDINDRSKIFVRQIHNEAKDYLPGLSEDQVSKWMQVQSVAPSLQAQNDAGPQTVIRTVNGKRYKFDAQTKQNLGEVQ